MENTDHILIVDDDREIRSLLANYLQKNGLRATTVPDGKRMQEILQTTRIDLIVLDLMLPDQDGLTLCRNLRAHSDLPVIMLTARGEEMDRILGLEMGADDYLPKPFVPRELLARIRTVLRRTRSLPPNLRQEGQTEKSLARFADWTLDTRKRQLTDAEGTVVPLSSAEYRLLHTFLQHPNRVLSRDQLLDLTQGREADVFDRSIDLMVSRLRRRLRDDAREPRLLRTVRSEGYVLTADIQWEG